MRRGSWTWWSIVLVFLGCAGLAGCARRPTRTRTATPAEVRRDPPRSAARTTTSTAADGRVAMTSEATALSMTIERTRSSGGDYFLHGTFSFEGWGFLLAVYPARAADEIGIVLSPPREEVVPGRICSVRVMADGVMLADPAMRDSPITADGSHGYRQAINVIVPRGELTLMATAERLAVRICDTELRLGPEHRAVMAELLLRLEEELRWLTVDSTTAAPVQDLTAVPPDAGTDVGPSGP